MAKLYLKDTSDITSVEVIGATVVLKNWHNGQVMVLSFRAYDEMVEHVKEERKEPLPTFEDVRGILSDKKGEAKDDAI